MSKELAAEVAEYSKHRYDDAPVSSQTQEELCRLKEANTESAKEYQWLDPNDYKDQEGRIGKVIDHRRFITLLRDAGVNCFYRQHVHNDKAVLYVNRNDSTLPEVACWVQIGQMPELSFMNFDAYGIPLAEKRRGWRTCLLQLILKGILSEDRANKYFGYPATRGPFLQYNAILGAARQSGMIH